MTILKRIAAVLPATWQSELKRIYFRRQIRRGTFSTNEPEYALLPKLVAPGEWAIDVGANIGHYTKRLSELVGTEGRVIAFEPVPETFALLSANVQQLPIANVTLVNAALSDSTGVVGMSIPAFEGGLRNFYQAHLSDAGNAELRVMTLRLDSLQLGSRIALVKIDAEGHERAVLDGMREILKRDQPILIVETWSDEIKNSLAALGYVVKALEGSSNVMFLRKGQEIG